ncbi:MULTISPECIES: Rid family detoxifying hydrolase [Flavobacterium]|uniref:Rid family detoxifying hydrolase n=1 Tax=Flavobacterium TaxID=237 RepID=UPI000F76B916|nr:MULTISPECIES: Rid family detoxifying hydrolase [Flavobacterium]MDP5200282.1 Rid family detoxifying hydrolase [Flavobacterium sp. DG2-3]
MKRTAVFLALLVFASCTNTKSIVSVNHSNLPKPIGPYSHSTSFTDLVFVSGQIGVDPKTNTLKNGIEEQTIQIFENLKAVLQNNSSDLDHIVKTTIFITDIKQYEAVNKIYGSYFHHHFPARSTIEIVSLPKNASIEIECIAVKK